MGRTSRRAHAMYRSMTPASICAVVAAPNTLVAWVPGGHSGSCEVRDGPVRKSGKDPVEHTQAMHPALSPFGNGG